MVAAPAPAQYAGQVIESAALPAHACWRTLAGPGWLGVDIWRLTRLEVA